MKRIRIWLRIGLPVLALMAAMTVTAWAAPSTVGEYSSTFGLPAQNYSLPLYTGPAADWQAITDARDSGCLIIDEARWSMPIIGDHAGQGFDIIKSAVVGETVATFDGEEYVCVRNEDGCNRGSDLVTLSGLGTAELGVDLLTYTCNSDGTVRLVGWMRK